MIAFGTLRATTAENAWFGIPKGQEVVLHVVNVASELSIGFFANFDHYGHLIQEMLMTLKHPANQVEVAQLRRLFTTPELVV